MPLNHLYRSVYLVECVCSLKGFGGKALWDSCREQKEGYHGWPGQHPCFAGLTALWTRSVPEASSAGAVAAKAGNYQLLLRSLHSTQCRHSELHTCSNTPAPKHIGAKEPKMIFSLNLTRRSRFLFCTSSTLALFLLRTVFLLNIPALDLLRGKLKVKTFIPAIQRSQKSLGNPDSGISFYWNSWMFVYCWNQLYKIP